MAPSPRKPTSAFDQTWHETDASFLDPASLPLAKIPRGWDRKAKSPYARDRGYKKVWRKYGLRSQPPAEQTSTASSGEEEMDTSRSPTRAVKKLRLKSEDVSGGSITIENKKPAFSATRWDRRKSGLPRKKPLQVNLSLENVESGSGLDMIDATPEPEEQEGPQNTEDQDEDEKTIEPQHSTKNPPTNAHTGSSRVSLLSNEADSTFSFGFGEYDEEPATHEDGSATELDDEASIHSPLFTKANETSYDISEFTTSAHEPKINVDQVFAEPPISPITQNTPVLVDHSSMESSSETVDMTEVSLELSALNQEARSPAQTSSNNDREAVDMTKVSIEISVLDQGAYSPIMEATVLGRAEPALEPSSPKNCDTNVSTAQFDAIVDMSIGVQAVVPIVAEANALEQPERPLEQIDITILEKDDTMADVDLHMDASGSSVEQAIQKSYDGPQTLDESEIDWDSDDNTEQVETESCTPQISILQGTEISIEDPEEDATGSDERQPREESEIGWESDNIEAIGPESPIQEVSIMQDIEVPVEQPEEDITESSEPQPSEESETGWTLDNNMEAPEQSPTILEDTGAQGTEVEDLTVFDEASSSEENQGYEITESLDVSENVLEAAPGVIEESSIQETLNVENEQPDSAEEHALDEQLDEASASHIIDEETEELASLEGVADSEEGSSASIEDDLAVDSIADGLTLGPPSEDSLITERTRPKLRSPARPARLEVPQDDVTAYLDDDTAMLKDFLTRAAASKLDKAHKAATISRRSSLSHRRDSDAIRHALASPRKILEDKDVNSPAPNKSYDDTATIDFTQPLRLDPTPGSPSPDVTSTDADEMIASEASSRRSTRTRKSRIPPPSSHAQQPQIPKSIPVRRADGAEPIVLRRTEAQELGLLTRANTRKNKSGAVSAPLRIMKLSTEEALSRGPPIVDCVNGPRDGAGAGERKTVKWDETLVYFQETAKGDVLAVEAPADVEMVDVSSVERPTVSFSTPSVKPKPKSKDQSTSTPRVRRLRGLGAANGTPGKGLLGSESLLPDEVQEAVEEKKIPKPSKIRKLPVVATVDVTVAAVKPLKLEIALPTQAPPLEEREMKKNKERKSRIATPRKGKIPISTSATLPVPEKENRLATGLPKKALGVDAGLPRRRASRKL